MQRDMLCEEDGRTERFAEAMDSDLTQSPEEPPISSVSSDEDSPPSITPRSNGTSWWFKRQPARDTMPPPPIIPSDIEQGHAANLEHHLDRAVQRCIDTQDA